MLFSALTNEEGTLAVTPSANLTGTKRSRGNRLSEHWLRANTRLDASIRRRSMCACVAISAAGNWTAAPENFRTLPDATAPSTATLPTGPHLLCHAAAAPFRSVEV